MSSNKNSKLEIDIRRLLNKCEEMAKEDEENWKLVKFIETAENMITEMKNNTTKPDRDKLDGYMKRVLLLKGLLEAKRMEDRLEKSAAVQMLVPPSVSDSNRMKEIYKKNLTNCERDLREELLQDSFHLRKRTTLTDPSGSQEMDSVLKYHNVKHEEITTDMLSMTRNMKEQSQLAGKIIRDDTKLLEKSSKIMDDNYHHLQKQSNRLQDFITSSGWQCWIWILLAVMIIIFIIERRRKSNSNTKRQNGYNDKRIIRDYKTHLVPYMIFFMKVTRKSY